MTAADFIGPEGLIDPQSFIDTDEQWSTHNYHPLPVMISSGEEAWVTRRVWSSLPRLPCRLLGAELSGIAIPP